MDRKRLEELRDQLVAIAKEEYLKIAKTMPSEWKIGTPSDSINAYSILNNDRIGISYWYSGCNTGFNYMLKSYVVSKSGVNTQYNFYTLEDAQNFIQKNKCKELQNPYDCIINIEYLPLCDIDSEEYLAYFNFIDEDIKLIKTKVIKTKIRK